LQKEQTEEKGYDKQCSNLLDTLCCVGSIVVLAQGPWMSPSRALPRQHVDDQELDVDPFLSSLFSLIYLIYVFT